MSKAYVGIDLAANPSRCTGYALIECLNGCELRSMECLYGDDEIIKELSNLLSYDRLIVSIDAPLRESTGMRMIDKKLISAGFKVLPPGFKHMRSLTLRALKLIEELNSVGIRDIYETHPRSSLLSSRCSSVEELMKGLSISHKVYDLESACDDVRDAVIASIVSYCIDNGCSLKVEDVDGVVWLIEKVC
ncbi:MAG: DUF429 domain-containing protein [Sulfolobales archaeon]|nr:DUF429 domain-containing protein [Sulfolobales archaeon]MCX8186724.1 DUF429 domain-containing protein [Sulfolobales archaeon]MDW7969703.1 DUF429 domain-containing protein [Sulfolobales archaeon]